MEGSNGSETRINSFALVSYLTGPVAKLLDEIRHDFAPESRAKAHLTILPPRGILGAPPLSESDVGEIVDELRSRTQDFNPFQVELGDIEIFPDTQVIYVAVKAGFKQLEHLHDILSTGRLAFHEPFPYHPHVTVVQELAAPDVSNAAQFARWRWSEFNHSRSIMVERLTFVQNNLQNCWTDLAQLNLGSTVAR